MPTVYPPLSIGAPRRLALFKREAAQPHWVRPLTWRDVRFANLKSHSGLCEGANREGTREIPVWVAFDGVNFRNERFCDEVISSKHTGWFTDPDQDETARGIVASLPHGRFIAGYFLSMNDERVYFPDIFDDEQDAARMADEHARVIGEQESEYQARWREANKLAGGIDEALDELKKVRSKLHVSIAARESAGVCRQTRDYAQGFNWELREAAHELVKTIRNARGRLKNEFAGML